MFSETNIQEFVSLDKTNQAAVLASYMSMCRDESFYMALELFLLQKYGVDGLCMIIGENAESACKFLHIRGQSHE
jgi:hypothetical protein